MSTTQKGLAEFWWAEDSQKPPECYEVDPCDSSINIYRPEAFDTISTKLDSLDEDLRRLSLDIHTHPELKFEEIYAHDAMTSFMESQKGWVVRKQQFGLKTAWSATFTHGSGGRTLGVNSEQDALPGVGHACGHNLIAIAGIAVALAVQEALIKHDIPGKIILLGTPAEEGGSGKCYMLDAGAYKSMDACLMCHPAPGPVNGASLSASLAIQRMEVTFQGRTAHAALSPWEAQNALDASVLAYTNIGLLRQHIKPTHRIHGIFRGEDMAVNIIPDKSIMQWGVRAPRKAGVEDTLPRAKACLDAAALATGCTVSVEEEKYMMYELVQNNALGAAFAETYRSKFGPIDHIFGIASASTDFGNVSYAVPALHPGFSIPTKPNGGNHTREFAAAAATPEAHQACLNVAKTLALTGLRVLADDTFYEQVKTTFAEDMKARGA